MCLGTQIAVWPKWVTSPPPWAGPPRGGRLTRAPSTWLESSPGTAVAPDAVGGLSPRMGGGRSPSVAAVRRGQASFSLGRPPEGVGCPGQAVWKYGLWVRVPENC